VGADHSQLEPRTFAYLSGDTRLLKAFDGSSDFYSVIGMEVYQKSDCTPQKEGSPEAFGVKYKKLRDLSKVIALASTYGATAHQLAPTTGKSIEQTQQDIDNYFETFPDVKEFMIKSHELAKKNGYVENIFGRKRRMPEAKKFNKIYGNVAHGELPYEARNVLNLAVNHRVQSTGASIVNRNAIKFLVNCRLAGLEDVKLVLQVHDSLIAECKEEDAETVGLLLQDAMETAVILEGVSFEAIPKIGKSLAEV
jgi:DNA polymerase-1